jgi:hypothetical protein
MSALDLSKLPSHKVLTASDNKEFEKGLNDHVRSGWQVVNMQTEQQYDQMSKEWKYSFLAILVKQGLN